MSQEIGDPVMNLRRNAVKPLRGAARPQEARETLSVADLKNGGQINLGGLLEESGAPPLRAAGRKAPRGLSRQTRADNLPLPERLQKLAKIKKSATEYEALFVDQLVKLMRPSPVAHTPGGKIFSELAEQPFRDFLSQAGGLGLANTIVGQVARQEGLEQTLLEHPEVMGPSWRPTIPKNLGPKTSPRLSLAPEGLAAQGSAGDPGLPAGPGPDPDPGGRNEAEIARQF